MKTLPYNFAFCLLLLSFSFSAKAVSMGQVVGKVIEKEGMKSLPYAEITFENSMDKVTVTANEYGYYYADHLPTGKYQMRIVFNNRTFFMNKVRVYDSYTTEINFMVSNKETLPASVEVEMKENLFSSVTSTDIKLTDNGHNQQSRSLTDVLNMQGGVDVFDNKVYVKGSSQVKFFVDGTQVMGQPSLARGW